MIYTLLCTYTYRYVHIYLYTSRDEMENSLILQMNTHLPIEVLREIENSLYCSLSTHTSRSREWKSSLYCTYKYT